MSGKAGEHARQNQKGAREAGAPGDPVIAAAFNVQMRIGTFIGLLDQASFQHFADGPVEGARAEVPFAFLQLFALVSILCQIMTYYVSTVKSGLGFVWRKSFCA